MALLRIMNNDKPPSGAVRDGRLVDCKCRRCRHTWMEIDDSRHTEGSGTLMMCPRCLASAIDRTRHYVLTTNASHERPARRSKGDAMKPKEFRKELEKLMPGYAWTVHQTNAVGYLSATGTQSSGFNRLSTISVTRREQDGKIRYEAKSAGYGLRAKWLHTKEDGTLARALRGLQDYYEAQANTYMAHAESMKVGRNVAPNNAFMVSLFAITTAFVMSSPIDAHAETVYTNATVLSVVPQYVTQRQPVEVCQQVVARYRQPVRNGYGAGFGAILGGIVGSVGGVPGAVVGATTGAALGDKEEAEEVAAGVPVPVYAKHCETEWRETGQRLINYRIEYEAMGRRYITFEDYIPGTTIRVPIEINSR